jgi:hypothetical protein
MDKPTLVMILIVVAGFSATGLCALVAYRWLMTLRLRRDLGRLQRRVDG